MNKQKQDYDTLNFLLDAASDAAMAMSDSEILDEAVQDHADPKARVTQLRALAAENVALAKKRRLARARNALDSAKNPPVATSGGIQALTQMRTRISELLAQNFGSQNKLTLAFRNGEEMSETDIASLLEDLEELAARQQKEP